VIIGVALFAVLGIGLTALRVFRRQWLPAIASLLGSACAEMGYASGVMHMPWISVVSAIVGIGGSAVLWILMRRPARSTGELRPGIQGQAAIEYRPPIPPEQAPRPWPHHRPDAYREGIARVGMLIMPVVLIIAGIVGPSSGPAVFGAVWLPLSLWFVIVRPLLRKRRRVTYKRPW
jgi:hypothetical protein